MVKFFIHPDNEISPSVQLFDQISFAIISRAYTSGEQLPSTRQLAQQTGLHRNTINKVYQQLKKAGLVTSKGGSGMYAAPLKQELASEEASVQIIRQTLNQLLSLGYSLTQAQTLFNLEVNWRLSCSAKLIVTSGMEDAGVAQIIASELKEALDIPLQIIAIEELVETLERLDQNINTSTIVTNRYFAETARRMVGDRPIRIFIIDIYNYSSEIARIRKLPPNSSVGLVSISTGILRLAESLIQSIRTDVLVISVLPQDTYRLQSMLKTVDLVIAGHSLAVVKQAIAEVDRIRPLEVIYSGKYVSAESIKSLKLELGID